LSLINDIAVPSYTSSSSCCSTDGRLIGLRFQWPTHTHTRAE